MSLEKQTSKTKLTSDDFTQIEPGPSAPFELFQAWLDEAIITEPNDPTAMSVATVDSDGLPNVRILLLKGYDERGFVFYTNFESIKGGELLASGKAALCFHWKSLRRQVRVRGSVEVVSNEEADIYYNSRSEGSRIGAWASQQSRPLEERATLETAVKEYTDKFNGQTIPRPPHWSGFRVIPNRIEFWQDQNFRLHDRIVFSREDVNLLSWEKQRLYP
ncbi:MAG: pyridoxamine 5'-phosphate oxidase [Hyphomicrobiales bacterium]